MPARSHGGGWRKPGSRRRLPAYALPRVSNGHAGRRHATSACGRLQSGGRLRDRRLAFSRPSHRWIAHGTSGPCRMAGSAPHPSHDVVRCGLCTSSRAGHGPFGADDRLCILFVAFSAAAGNCLALQLHIRQEENKTTMSRFWSTTLLGAALMVPIALAPTVLRAQDQRASRTYQDKQHNDSHAWNGQEDKAYRIYAKQNHRKASDFSKLKENDQQSYWNWRHEHSDALLKIEIK